MKNKGIKYEYISKVWKHGSPAGWYFISLTQESSKEIRENLKWQEEGWGRLKVSAKTGSSGWETAIWFDTKMKTYLLPLKADIRKKENIHNGDSIKVTLWI